MSILVTTPAAANANAYCTSAEADAYHALRLHASAWTGGEKEKALAMATRLLDAFLTWTGDVYTQQPSSRLPAGAYYAWTGSPSTEAQALCWPRLDMYTRNGVAIPSGEIPTTLKYATAEFARQLMVADRSLDSDIEAQGITSLKAGPVSLTFKDIVERKMMPDAVLDLLVPSWYVVSADVEPAYVFKMV